MVVAVGEGGRFIQQRCPPQTPLLSYDISLRGEEYSILSTSKIPVMFLHRTRWVNAQSTNTDLNVAYDLHGPMDQKDTYVDDVQFRRLIILDYEMIGKNSQKKCKNQVLSGM